MRELTIRKATIDDLEILARLEFESRNGAFMEMYGNTDGVPKIVDLLPRWRAKLNGNYCYIIVGEVEGQVAAYANLQMKVGYLKFELNGLYVFPQYWRQGIASQLLNFLISLIKRYADKQNQETGSTQAPQLSLHVIEGNKRACDFYLNKGFNYTSEFEMFTLGNRELKLLEMRLLLD